MVSMLLVLCDACFEKDERVEATPVTLGVDGVWWTIHLCDNCGVDFATRAFADVVEFYREHGETQGEAATVDPEMFPCLYCERTFNKVPSLMYHLKATHDLMPADNPWGNVCPLCGDKFDQLSGHTTRAHGLHVSQAMLKSENDGDTFRVVGAIKKRRRNA